MTEQVTAAPAAVALEWLPWHDGARARLETALAGARMPHGLLLHGPDGVGKQHFAAVLAAGLYCRSRSSDLTPCGTCPECVLCRAGSHPDLYWLRRPEDKKTIGVDAVREACEQLSMTSLRGGYRVAIIAPANAMTTSAQNALLKTLEEPAARTLLVLVTSRPSGLLATLRSRCQRVEVARPPASQASDWLAGQLGTQASSHLLEFAGGAPLKALLVAPHFAQLESQMSGLLGELLGGDGEVTRFAAEMMGEGLPTRLDWLEYWLGSVVRSRTVPDATQLTVPGGPLLQSTADEVNISAAFRILDRLRDSRRLLEGSAAPQLVIEALLIELKATIRRKGVA